MARTDRAWTLGLTSVAFFMVTLDALVVVTALPSIHRELGASLADLEWTINAFTLAFAAGIVTAAAAGDRFGRRRIFSIGLALFTTQRFGTAFAIAIASAVFAANGHLGTAASFTEGFRPALMVVAGLSVLGTLTALGERRAVIVVDRSLDLAKSA